MPFALQKIEEVGGDSLKDLIKQAKNGERIVLHRGLARSMAMWPTSYDFYHEDQNTIFKNGEPCFEGEFDDWEASLDGFIVKVGNRYLRNGIELIVEGEYSDWAVHPEGIVTLKTYLREKLSDEPIPNEVWLNGKKIIHKCTFATSLKSHEQGFVVNYGNGTRWLLNGTHVLVNGRPYTLKDSQWEPWGKEDLVLYRHNEFLLNAGAVMHRDWCNTWMMHRHGIVLWQHQTISLVVLRK